MRATLTVALIFLPVKKEMLMKKEKVTELPFKVKINQMAYGYFLIGFYFNWYAKGLMSEKHYNVIKNQMLYYNTKETYYNDLEGNEWVTYFTEAFDELFKIFQIGAITEEEFEKHYNLLKRKPKYEND